MSSGGQFTVSPDRGTDPSSIAQSTGAPVANLRCRQWLGMKPDRRHFTLPFKSVSALSAQIKIVLRHWREHECPVQHRQLLSATSC